ncbi:MAG: hypothetical protein R2734_18270 [Nocardioides sp.]
MLEEGVHQEALVVVNLVPETTPCPPTRFASEHDGDAGVRLRPVAVAADGAAAVPDAVTAAGPGALRTPG